MIIHLTLTFLLLGALCLFLLIKHVSDKLWLFGLIPVTLGMTALLYVSLVSLTDKPAPFDTVTQEFQLLKHQTVGGKIYLWLLVKGAEAPRTYFTPSILQSEKELQEADRKAAAGIPVHGKRRAAAPGQDGQQAPFELYDFSAKFYDLKG